VVVQVVKKGRVKSVNSRADMIMMRQVTGSESSTRQNHVCDKQDWALKMSRKGREAAACVRMVQRLGDGDDRSTSNERLS
jgi:hypothetical protein